MYTKPFGSIFGEASLIKLSQKPKPGFLGEDSAQKAEQVVIPEIKKQYATELLHPKAQLAQANDSKRKANQKMQFVKKQIKKLERKKTSLQSLILIFDKIKTLTPLEQEAILGRLSKMRPALEKINKAKNLKDKSEQLSNKIAQLDTEISRWEDIKLLKAENIPMAKEKELVSVVPQIAQFRSDETPKTPLPIFKTATQEASANQDIIASSLKSAQLGNLETKKQLLKVIDDLPKKPEIADTDPIEKKVEQTWVAAKETQFKLDEILNTKEKLQNTVNALTEQAASLALELENSKPAFKPFVSSLSLITELKPNLLENQKPLLEILKTALKGVSTLDDAEAQAEEDTSNLILNNAESEANALSVELQSREYTLAKLKSEVEGTPPPAPPAPIVVIVKPEKNKENNKFLAKIIPLAIILLIVWRLTR